MKTSSRLVLMIALLIGCSLCLLSCSLSPGTTSATGKLDESKARSVAERTLIQEETERNGGQPQSIKLDFGPLFVEGDSAKLAFEENKGGSKYRMEGRFQRAQNGKWYLTGIEWVGYTRPLKGLYIEVK